MNTNIQRDIMKDDARMIRKNLQCDFLNLAITESHDTGFSATLKARNNLLAIHCELDPSKAGEPGMEICTMKEPAGDWRIPFDGNISTFLPKAVQCLARAYGIANAYYKNEERYEDAPILTEAEYRMVCNCISWLQTDYETCRRLLGRNYMDAICGMAIVVDWYATGEWSDGDPSDTSPYEYGKFVESPYGERTYFTTGYTGIAGDYWNSFWR